LNAFGHLFLVFVLLIVFQQAGKVKVGVSHLEALDVKGMLKEHPHIIDLFLLAEVLPDFITKNEYGLDNLLLIKLKVFLSFIFGAFHDASCASVFGFAFIGS